MNNKIKHSIAGICAAAVICNPIASSSVISGVKQDTLVASAAESGTVQKSGTWSGYDLIYNDEAAGCRLCYTINNDHVIITGCETSKANTRIRIPKQIKDKDVTGIADNAFKDQTNIIEVHFYGKNEIYLKCSPYGYVEYRVLGYQGGSSISYIGESAFEGCTNLSLVRVGDKELSVGKSAFSGCNNLTSISFYNSSNRTISPVYGDIGSRAFENTGFTTFTPSKCNSIGSRCFQKCGALTNVKIKAESIGEYCFSRAYEVKNAELDVKKIGAYAFSGCSKLENLKLTNTVTISKHAFENCTELKVMDLPKTLTTVGEFAFYKTPNLRTPVLFLRENGESLYIGRAAFNTSGVEYVVLSGNIKVDDYAFFQCSLKGAVVEGNVELNQYAIGFIDRENVAPGFAIYGDTDTNKYAEECGVPYIKADKSQSYNKIINENKANYNGARKFHNENGSCAAIVITQMMYLTNKIDIYDYIPREYKGKTVRGLIDVPAFAGIDEYRDKYPEFSELTERINEMQADRNYTNYVNSAYQLPLTTENLEGYAKLTEYGLSFPGYLRISTHRHAVACFGIEKLAKPRTFENAYKDPSIEYDYRIITCDNGYMFKYDQNENLIACGYDKNTSGDTWIKAEDTFIYIRSSDGKCYEQRYDDAVNVDTSEKVQKYNKEQITLGSLELLPASTIEKYK
ncbi:leucine-rich repeat domain-containing protein [Ruminococcus flavefaciens]|uniref:Leucine rich repeat-containing protein n=1 Tax=Ruminococcus flavefaciens TaxID=1265 RepID=A0A1M7G961_RUMFL|nr:leucine-rich repeat domain-containing protein [Ruminococcus flavefaciens]SHM12820.1 Leucine rich repeat-containing protein [Ruminococcus flavefaciens]